MGACLDIRVLIPDGVTVHFSKFAQIGLRNDGSHRAGVIAQDDRPARLSRELDLMCRATGPLMSHAAVSRRMIRHHLSQRTLRFHRLGDGYQGRICAPDGSGCYLDVPTICVTALTPDGRRQPARGNVKRIQAGQIQH